MVSFRHNSDSVTHPKLGNLQRTQEEIYRQVLLLMPDETAAHDSFKSVVSGSPELRLHILERHPYTHFVRLTYCFGAEAGTRLAPNAHIRVYHDARIAEVTAFNAEQAFNRSAHPWYPTLPLLRKSWRENVALDKWLGYLLQQGHSFETMRPADSGIPAEVTSSETIELV